MGRLGRMDIIYAMQSLESKPWAEKMTVYQMTQFLLMQANNQDEVFVPGIAEGLTMSIYKDVIKGGDINSVKYKLIFDDLSKLVDEDVFKEEVE